MILDRPWAEELGLQRRVPRGRRGPACGPVPGGRPHHEASRHGADEIRRLLAADLDVPAALEVAIETGGAAARLLIATLGLD